MVVSPVGELELTPGPGYESGGEMERPMYVITETERSTQRQNFRAKLPVLRQGRGLVSHQEHAAQGLLGSCLTRHECYRRPIVQRSSPQSQHTLSVGAAIASTTGREVHALSAANVLDFFFFFVLM